MGTFMIRRGGSKHRHSFGSISFLSTCFSLRYSLTYVKRAKQNAYQTFSFVFHLLRGVLDNFVEARIHEKGNGGLLLRLSSESALCSQPSVYPMHAIESKF